MFEGGFWIIAWSRDIVSGLERGSGRFNANLVTLECEGASLDRVGRVI